jgi:hypothetical protein
MITKHGFFVVLGLISLPGFAETADVPLGRGIPSDSFFYLRRQASPQLAPLGPALERTGKAAREALFSDESLQFLLDLLDQSISRPEAAQWRKLLDGVDWGKLLAKEWAFGARFEIPVFESRVLDSNSRVDWIALFRVEAADRDRVLRGLRGVVRHFTTLEEKSEADPAEKSTFEAVDAEREGSPITILATPQGETRLCVGGQGDVIAAASSGWEMRRAFQLLAGEGSGLGVNESQDYARLMQGLPAAGSGEMVLRPDLIFQQLRMVAKAVEEIPVRNSKVTRDVEDVLRGLNALVETLDLVKGVAVSETVEGRRLVEDCRIDLVEEASKRLLYPAFFDRPPLGDLARLVPRGVWGFAATSGVDALKLHEGLLEAMKKLSPDTRLLADEYIRLQGKAGIDVEQDILGLFDGRAVLLAFPQAAAAGEKKGEPEEKAAGAGPGDGGPGGRVVVLGLKDPDRAAARLEEWVGRGGQSLSALGMGLEKVEIAGVPGTFRRLALPFPPGLELTFGVSGGQLAIGTSKVGLSEALKVRKGEIEGVDRNPAFRSLDVAPQGDPGAVCFVDLKEAIRVTRAGLREVGPLAAMIPDDSEGGLGTLKRLLLLAPHLDRVLSTLDFVDLSGGWLSRDGKAYRGKLVITLRTPEEAAPPGKDTKKQTF